MPYRLVWLLRKFYIFIKWPVSRDSLLPFGIITSNIMDFKENDLFQRKWTYFSEITDFSASKQISKESLISFAVSSQKIVYFHKMNRFQWNQLISRNNWNEQILTNFQKTAFYRLLYLSEILQKSTKWTDFKGFLAWYQKSYFWWKIPIFPIKGHTVQCISVENDIFSSNYQISMTSKK